MTDEQLTAGAKVVDLPPAPPPQTMVLQPTVATVIGSLGDNVPTTGTVAISPGAHQPNVIMNIVTPTMAITVRFLRMFLTSVMGFLTLSMVPTGGSQVMTAIHALDFYHLVLTAVGVSLAPAVLDLGRNLVTVLGRLEQKYPLATGSI